MKLPRAAQDAIRVFEVGLRATARGPKPRDPEGVAVGAAGGNAVEVPPVDTSNEEQALFISVKPKYAAAILDGTKTVELRRTRPNLPDGSLVILYSSTPTRAVVGWAQLTAVHEGTPGQIWAACGAAAGIDEPTFEDYFDGAELAFALGLKEVVAASRPVPLNVVRSLGLQPPQSWRYVPKALSSQIQESAAP